MPTSDDPTPTTHRDYVILDETYALTDEATPTAESHGAQPYARGGVVIGSSYVVGEGGGCTMYVTDRYRMLLREWCAAEPPDAHKLVVVVGT